MQMYAAIALFATFISSISQVMLKKSAQKEYASALEEYLNPLVIGAYTIFVGATLLTTIAFGKIPLSMGPIIDATGYVYVSIFGVLIFHEKLGPKKILALLVIIAGIAIYSLGI